jgi:hypothetical protein
MALLLLWGVRVLPPPRACAAVILLTTRPTAEPP